MVQITRIYQNLKVFIRLHDLKKSLNDLTIIYIFITKYRSDLKRSLYLDQELSNWVWPVTPENWSTVKEKKVWAVGTEGKGKRVLKGDKIIFYVNGTLHFHGIFEVKSDWHKPTLQWPDETSVGEYAVSEINLEEIQFGYASVNKLHLSLNFIEKKNPGLKGLYLRGTPLGPANSGKPISKQDYNLILNELKQVQTEPNFKKIKEVENDFEELVELPPKSFRTEKIPPPDKKTLEEKNIVIHHLQEKKLVEKEQSEHETKRLEQVLANQGEVIKSMQEQMSKMAESMKNKEQ